MARNSKKSSPPADSGKSKRPAGPKSRPSRPGAAQAPFESQAHRAAMGKSQTGGPGEVFPWRGVQRGSTPPAAGGNPDAKYTLAPDNNTQAPAADEIRVRPEILAPAGDMPAALAAFAAGADAVYLGLKHFSARMQAENFSTTDLARLAVFAHSDNRRIYVAMNTLIKPGEPAQAYRLIRRLADYVRPDALIIQDPGMLDLARQAGFAGELHLSTLANVTHPKALLAARELGASRVIVPRELSFAETRRMSETCPAGLDLEIFVHGALCYCVSGRCWWSSYMGGKSGLRGRCVQPCRRQYTQKGREGRFFSCLDLSLDTDVRSLLSLERIRSWKIEGRKKGPHYVYYVTTAYRLLRDEPDSPEARAEAARVLGMALGRPGTRSRFIDGGAESPTAPPPGKEPQTSSGLLCGRISKSEDGRFSIRPRLDLLPKDLLRVGYEDEPWHCTLPVSAKVARDTVFSLPLPRVRQPKPGTPVFLIDRREAELGALLAEWNRELRNTVGPNGPREDLGNLSPLLPAPPRSSGRPRPLDIRLLASLPHGREGKTGLRPGAVQGLWLSPKALREVSRTLYGRISWWLPPVIWPDEEEQWSRLLALVRRDGGRHFVCNSPWQAAFFPERKGLALSAGPFCNIANAPALGVLASMGFEAAMISPELSGEDILALPAQSPLPLGLVISGFWPVGLTRHRADPLKAQEPFQSPKGEEFWMRRYGQNLWLYPAWPLDLSAHRPALEQAGYTTFVHMEEHPPRTLPPARRVSEFNWKVDVL